MNTRKVSLAGLMDQWNGQDVVLKVQGGRMVVAEGTKSKIKRNDGGNMGLFSRLAQGSRNSSYRLNAGKENLEEPQFVIKAKSRTKEHRVSLADMGDLYNTSRFKGLKHDRRVSQNYGQNCSSNRPISNVKTACKNSSARYENTSKYQYNTEPKRPSALLESQNYQQYQQYQQPEKRKSHPYGGFNEKQCEQIEKIKESINGIKLPSDQTFSPEYMSANDRFEKMKKEILQKIIETGEMGQLSQILKQIKQAADQIIARHQPPELTLQKNIFSFKCIQPQPLSLQPCLNLNPICLQGEDKGSNLPQFKDDAGSISSILSGSGLGIKKDESKDEDDCKIANVFIQDNHDLNCLEKMNKAESSINSIKLIKLQDKKEDDMVDILKEIKQEQKVEFKNQPKFEESIRVQESFKPKPVVHANIYNVGEKLIAQKIPQVKESLFKKRQEPSQPFQATTIPYESYNLQRLTSEPVKIISNLQQAKNFDPEVTKYTELKVQYLQTRTIAPEIIRISSPMRFRRKQQVVKHLVANHVVQKQSNSIQF